MKSNGLAVILLLVAVLFLPQLVSQSITALIEPPYIEASPGESVDLRLIVRNLGSKEIEVTGLRVYVTSEEVFFLPIRANFGEYQIPFDEPTKVTPGGEEVIHKTIEVPNVPVFGKFLLKIRVETTGGYAFSELRVDLKHSNTSIGVFLFLLLILMLVVYALIRMVRGRLSSAGRFKRRVSKVDALLAEKERILELMRKLEEKRKEGTVGETEYRRLKEEYERSLEEVQAKLDSYLEPFKSMLSNIEQEIARLKEEREVVRAKMEVGDLTRGEGKKVLKEKDKAIKSLEERARVLRDRIERIERT